MRNLFLAEVISKPWHSLNESLRAQRLVAHRPAAMPPRGFQKNIPERLQLAELHNKFSTRYSARSTPHHLAGNCSSRVIRARVVCRYDLSLGRITRHPLPAKSRQIM